MSGLKENRRLVVAAVEENLGPGCGSQRLMIHCRSWQRGRCRTLHLEVASCRWFRRHLPDGQTTCWIRRCHELKQVALGEA